jgi:hypothetical protein
MIAAKTMKAKRMAKKKGRPGRAGGTPRGFVRFEIQVPPEVAERIDAAAEALLMSRSAWVRVACLEKLARDSGQALAPPES